MPEYLIVAFNAKSVGAKYIFLCVVYTLTWFNQIQINPSNMPINKFI